VLDIFVPTEVHEVIGGHNELALDVYVYGASLVVGSEIKVAISQLLQVSKGLSVLRCNLFYGDVTNFRIHNNGRTVESSIGLECVHSEALEV
jgi:hypothetical protein